MEKDGFVGTYVTTLSLSIVAGADWQPLSTVTGSFLAKGDVACCLAGDNLVLCRGHVIGACPQEHDPECSRNVLITRLPEGMRPHHALQFAAQLECRHGRSNVPRAQLVTLVVTPDGWVQGLGMHETEGTLDLSAIRFGIGRSILVADEVRLYACAVGGTRLVVLQGTLTERSFAADGKKPLGILPQSCRPPGGLPFVVAGARAGGFHLVAARPSRALGVGGELFWDDGIWSRDTIHLTGIIYEVDPAALQLSAGIADWTPARRRTVVRDFQRLLQRRFGSIGAAWNEAFDLDSSGNINFTEFGHGCKVSGFCGNVTRLWSMFDEDGSGEITRNELEADLSDSP